MANQQVTETELAWLAGILDGEGSFGIQVRTENGKVIQLVPAVQITNTSADIIEAITNICKRLDVTFYLTNPLPNYPGAKQQFMVRLSRLGMVEQFIIPVMPYLRAKRAQADLLLQYVRGRIARGAERGSPHASPTRAPYSDGDLTIARTIRSLNSGKGRRATSGGNPQRPYVGQPSG